MTLGLIPKREYVLLKSFVDGYIDSRTEVETETSRAWRQVASRLEAAFGADALLARISSDQAAEWRQGLVSEDLSEATVRKYTGYAKHFFSVAVDRDLLMRSPFEKRYPGRSETTTAGRK